MFPNTRKSMRACNFQHNEDSVRRLQADGAALMQFDEGNYDM